MTLLQEAHMLIDELQDEKSVRFFVTMLRAFKDLNLAASSNTTRDRKAKIRAFQHMEATKKSAGYPRNYDYKQVYAETIAKKHAQSDG